MGWSHALWWCQVIHERLVEKAGLLPSQRLADKAAVPDLAGAPFYAHLEYVDNFAALSTSPAVVEQCAEKVRRVLTSAGLPVHEVEECRPVTQLLGWILDG
eukprot:5187029-Heterocapsa_arctica.AAC.1